MTTYHLRKQNMHQPYEQSKCVLFLFLIVVYFHSTNDKLVYSIIQLLTLSRYDSTYELSSYPCSDYNCVTPRIQRIDR